MSAQVHTAIVQPEVRYDQAEDLEQFLGDPRNAANVF